MIHQVVKKRKKEKKWVKEIKEMCTKFPSHPADRSGPSVSLFHMVNRQQGDLNKQTHKLKS